MNIETNLRFIQRNNLVRATLMGLFFWILVFLLVPLKVRHQIGVLPFFYLFLNYVFFILGLKVISPVKKENRLTFSVNIRVLKNVLWIVILIAFIGFFLKFLDQFYIRGASFTYSMSYNWYFL